MSLILEVLMIMLLSVGQNRLQMTDMGVGTWILMVRLQMLTVAMLLGRIILEAGEGTEPQTQLVIV